MGMNDTRNHWAAAHTIETTASREAVWRLFEDVAGWPSWNAGIERIALLGPFANGTTFTMKTPGQDAFASTLVDVRANERFVDETRVGDLVVRVAHTIDRDGASRGSRVTYAIEVDGPGAEEIGPAIAADFPDVLRALKEKAEAR
jgi:hypothetical protein